MKTPKTDALWRAFRAANLEADDHYDVIWFGDSDEMADELADLVTAGTKRATAAALRSFGDDEPVPKVGDYIVLVDGSRQPRCIWRTIDVEIKPLNEVDEQFAWDEGEGDRTVEWWLNAHRWYLAREAAREGYPFEDSIMTVFERFTVVWPPELADSPAP
ncbi:uncharacterized protein YhfF [Kibdelosporangium banguiense]|uniref:Uncharacterized protein YhfF n=1 Tax=Kibdelosporangium banguiense TaxID=1365924 RepID=A0ABS4TYX5_9PSEU|nr:ASCH domain-containing protein [Kibdelosporangium banguiense]MBP2329602.1 uncharacterized protein YhfF [Kibdelosporangium banguiense]